ncbi:DUF981 family protein [Mumia zhuanghuii]|nr:DUF981 family protein [Mumia zhuanghuii]
MVLAEGLKIDWATMPTYNTIMAVAVGAGLIGLVWLARDFLKDPSSISPSGWALNFGVLGTILTLTGAHMTLTWPLAAGGFPFDNIIFGETSLGFGLLLLFAAFGLWRRGDAILAAENPREAVKALVKPIGVFVFGLGLGLIAIAVAGIKYQLFAAPAEEPISGAFADYPMVEATFMSGLIALVGVGAVLFPFVIDRLSRGVRAGRDWVASITGWVWGITGVAFLLFGAMNFFTHIGLIVNTM